MKTNYMTLLEIEKHYKEHNSEIRWGILAEREKNLIEEELNLKEKSLVELQNARDFTVLYITSKVEQENVDNNRFLMDMLSAIVYVIDCEKLNKGGNV